MTIIFVRILGEKMIIYILYGSPHTIDTMLEKQKRQFFISYMNDTLKFSCYCPCFVRSHLLIYIGETCSQTVIVMFRHVFSLVCLSFALDSFHLGFILAVVYSLFSFVFSSRFQVQSDELIHSAVCWGCGRKSPCLINHLRQQRSIAKTHATHTFDNTLKYSVIWSSFAQLLFYMNIVGNYDD